jgi:hypothetical protein
MGTEHTYRLNGSLLRDVLVDGRWMTTRVFKRLADDHVLRIGNTVPAPEAGQPASRSPFGDVAENPTKAVAATEPVASSNTAAIDDGVAANDALSGFQVDAIADQFAAF